MSPKGADPSEKGSELARRQRDTEAVPVQEMGALIVSLCSWPGIYEVQAYSEAKPDGASDPAAVGRYVGDPKGYYFDVAKGRQTDGEELYDVAGARVFIWRGDREDPSVNVVIAADAGTSAQRAFHGNVAPFLESSPHAWNIAAVVLNRSDGNQ